MSSLGSPNPFFIAGKKAYEIKRSLRFNDNDSPYFDFTPSGAGSNQMTFSFWIKRANLVDGVIFSSGAVNARGHIYFSSNQLYVQPFNSTGASASCSTNMLFRDSSAWYHIVISLNNTTYSNMSSTINIYVNGVAVTFTTSNNNNPSGGNRFNDSQAKHIGQFRPQSGSFFDGYLAEFNFIDGQVLDQSSFGATNPATGQWNPKKYIGGYGSNGFYLNFLDNSGTTATTLGKDSSGNGNNWTPNNFSVSAGSGNDSVEDTPTNNWCTLNPLASIHTGNVTTSNGNLDASFGTVSGGGGIASSFVVRSGKWYWEITITAASGASIHIGILDENIAPFSGSPFYNPGLTAESYAYANNGTKYNNNTNTSYGASYTTNDVIGVALDLDNGTITFYKNNSSQGQAFSGLTGGFSPAIGDGSSAGTHSISANFGQRAFSYTAPTGYKELNSANLPDPTIKLPNKHFDTLTWAGDGSANRSITGLQFEPDWTWIKNRSQATTHSLQDSVIGFGDDKTLRSDTNGALDTNGNLYGYINNALSNGVSLNAGSSASSSRVNSSSSGATHVGWFWDAGETDGKTYTVTVVDDSGNKYRFDGFGTSAVTLDLAEGGTYIFNYPSAHPFRFSTTSDGTHGGGSEYTTGVTVLSSTSIQIVVAASAPTLYYYCSSHSGMGGQVNTNTTLGSSNFDGDLQSVTKVNATAGFSIVKWTSGASTYKTVGHGLGVKPDIVIVKSRSVATGWFTFYDFVDGTNDYLQLNSTASSLDAETYSIVPPTSTVFGTEAAFVSNTTNATMIAYAFSSVAGYSKFGSYTGNGNADGTFVFTGFRPAWIMTKRTDSSSDWFIWDNKRSAFNVANILISPNKNDAEISYTSIDLLSNGFKVRTTGSDINASSGTIVYFAFAESPFKNARAR